LGTISHVFDTGANDVMVIRGERERLVPFIAEVVDAVDLAAGVVRVDWDPEF
jgi:16S rRNA processing protein RimM